MELIVKNNNIYNIYVLRLDKGEELISKITEFCEAQQVEAGIIVGAIGATSEIEVSWYDLTNKQYVDKLITQDMEVTSLSGNVSKLADNKLFIHAHGTFSDQNMNIVGGHVKKLIVSATLEVTIIKIWDYINRAFSEDIGLNLMLGKKPTE